MHYIHKNRKDKIKEILGYLESNLLYPSPEQFSIRENLFFFQSITNILSFFRWYFNKAILINKDEILEFNDFCDQHFSIEFLLSLTKLEQEKFPGIIKPFVKEVSNIIKYNPIFTILNWGAGSMKIERQLIELLIKNKNKKQYVFIGIDKSEASLFVAVTNYQRLESYVFFQQVDSISDVIISNIKQRTTKLYIVIFCNRDVFSLEEELISKKVELVISSFFMHHLSNSQKLKLYNLGIQMSDRIIEYDGYKSWFVLIRQSIFTWRNPLLLNGVVFSNLRYLEKKRLKEIGLNCKIRFYFRGTYLRKCFKNNKSDYDKGIRAHSVISL